MYFIFAQKFCYTIETVDHKIPVWDQINKFFFLSFKENQCGIFAILKVMLFFCYKTEKVKNTKCLTATLPAKITTLAFYALLCLSFW